MCFWRKQKRRRKIGLALGSGGAKGLAHIGVIKIFEENNIPIHCIVGSSIGALIGGLYAATGDLRKIEALAARNNWRQLLKLVWDPAIKGGLISGKKIETFIRQQIGEMKFSALKIPFAAVATNFGTGEPVVIKNGDVAFALRSSLSVPIVFHPVEQEGQILVDGGLSEPVPISAARDLGAEVVVAVNLDTFPFNKKRKIKLFEAAVGSLNILRYHLAQEKIKAAEIVIEPKVFASPLVGWRQFLESNKFITEGEKATRAVLPKLKKLARF